MLFFGVGTNVVFTLLNAHGARSPDAGKRDGPRTARRAASSCSSPCSACRRPCCWAACAAASTSRACAAPSMYLQAAARLGAPSGGGADAGSGRSASLGVCKGFNTGGSFPPPRRPPPPAMHRHSPGPSPSSRCAFDAGRALRGNKRRQHRRIGGVPRHRVARRPDEADRGQPPLRPDRAPSRFSFRCFATRWPSFKPVLGDEARRRVGQARRVRALFEGLEVPPPRRVARPLEGHAERLQGPRPLRRQRSPRRTSCAAPRASRRAGSRPRRRGPASLARGPRAAGSARGSGTRGASAAPSAPRGDSRRRRSARAAGAAPPARAGRSCRGTAGPRAAVRAWRRTGGDVRRGGRALSWFCAQACSRPRWYTQLPAKSSAAPFTLRTTASRSA